MNRHVVGWLWVAGQALLLVALAFLPGGDAWELSGFVGLAGRLLFFGGLALIVIAALRLGTSLTPTPVPTSYGQLKTTGLYGFVRHPIYTGVIITVAGMAIRSASWIHVVIAVVTVAYFDRKAAWEEQELRRHYPGYASYAAKTGKFFPTRRTAGDSR